MPSTGWSSDCAGRHREDLAPAVGRRRCAGTGGRAAGGGPGPRRDRRRRRPADRSGDGGRRRGTARAGPALRRRPPGEPARPRRARGERAGRDRPGPRRGATNGGGERRGRCPRSGPRRGSRGRARPGPARSRFPRSPSAPPASTCRVAGRRTRRPSSWARSRRGSPASSAIVVATPATGGGEPHEAVLAACAIAGVDEILALGGAHGIAALAVGTATLRPGRRDRWARRPLGTGGEAGGEPLDRDRRLRGAVGARRRRRRFGARRVARARPLRAGRARSRRPARRDLHRRGAGRSVAAAVERIAAGSRASAMPRSSVVIAPRHGHGGRARRGARPRAPRALLRRGSRARGARSAAPAASSPGRSGRPRSATTPRAPTTCCRPAAPAASPGRSGRARSGAGSASSRWIGASAVELAGTVESIAGAEGFLVHGASAAARAAREAPEN